MKSTFWSAIILCLLVSPAVAQGVSGTSPPCTSFGSASGTCTQGNDARLGAGAVTGAIKSNGSNSFSQAASTDLSDTSLASWTPTDASGAGLSFSSVSAQYTKVGKQVCVSGYLVYPATANGASAIIGGLPFVATNNNYSNVPLNVTTTAALVTDGVVQKNTSTIAIALIAALGNVTNANLTGATVIINGCYISQ